MNVVDFHFARKNRDRKLRKALLQGLYFTRREPDPRLIARTLVDVVNRTRHGDQRTEDDGHAMALLRDLSAKGLITIEHLTRHRGEAVGLDNMRATISATGTSLIEESIAADPDIDDERITEEF